jgi:hypothetical protein
LKREFFNRIGRKPPYAFILADSPLPAVKQSLDLMKPDTACQIGR